VCVWVCHTQECNPESCKSHCIPVNHTANSVYATAHLNKNLLQVRFEPTSPVWTAAVLPLMKIEIITLSP